MGAFEAVVEFAALVQEVDIVLGYLPDHEDWQDCDEVVEVERNVQAVLHWVRIHHWLGGLDHVEGVDVTQNLADCTSSVAGDETIPA